MTELLSRAASTDRRTTSVDGTAIVGFGVVGALMAVGTGLLVLAVVVLVTWIASPGSVGSAADAMRTVGQVWLLGHRVSLDIAGMGHLALMPLGLLALPAYAVMRAGTWVVHAAGLEDIRGAVI